MKCLLRAALPASKLTTRCLHLDFSERVQVGALVVYQLACQGCGPSLVLNVLIYRVQRALRCRDDGAGRPSGSLTLGS